MAEHASHSSGKAGLPPGTLVHVGRRRGAGPEITVFDYDRDTLEKKEFRTVSKTAQYKEKPTVTWINVRGVGDLGVLEKIGKLYDLHPLTLEDIANTHQRPKVEDYGHYVFVVLRMLMAAPASDSQDSADHAVHAMTSSQVSLVLGANYVISFQEAVAGDVFDPVRDRIRGSKGRIRTAGADYLLYALMDAVVDGYFCVLEDLGERMESLEKWLLTDPGAEALVDIQKTKRELIEMRRSIWPLRDVVAGITRAGSELVSEETAVYFRDVQDHAMRLVDHVETNREALSGLLDIYLSNVSNRMNAVMKVLTVIATIFIPLSFFAGVYGMNFRNMPEYGWKYGYPIFWAVMVAIVAAMVVFFRRKKWL